ncbi:MAG: Gfo/Idh/MocA family protein [Opitutales bacterium]
MRDSYKKSLALIGCGYWGKNLARNFHELGALHSICEPDVALAAKNAEMYSDVSVVGDMDFVLSNPEIKQMAIATPAATHFQIAEKALIAGKDVFVEKPICLDLEEAKELKECAMANGRILMVGHLLQYHPAVIELQNRVVDGFFGKIHTITSRRLNLGKIRKEEDVLWSFAPHDISVILSLLPDSEIESVQCRKHFYLNKGVADMASMDIHFKGNQYANIQVSWLNPFKEQKLTIVGEKAMAVFDDTQPWGEKLFMRSDYLNSSDIHYIPLSEREPLADECRHFLNSCATRENPKTDAAEGIAVLNILHQASNT